MLGESVVLTVLSDRGTTGNEQRNQTEQREYRCNDDDSA